MRVGEVLLRVASATSVVRTRNEGITRIERNGTSDLKNRESVVLARLERVAEKLEKALS